MREVHELLLPILLWYQEVILLLPKQTLKQKTNPQNRRNPLLICQNKKHFLLINLYFKINHPHLWWCELLWKLRQLFLLKKKILLTTWERRPFNLFSSEGSVMGYYDQPDFVFYITACLHQSTVQENVGYRVACKNLFFHQPIDVASK